MIFDKLYQKVPSFGLKVPTKFLGLEPFERLSEYGLVCIRFLGSYLILYWYIDRE